MSSLSRGRRVAWLAAPSLLFCGVLLGIEAVVRLAMSPISSLELFVVAPEQQAQFEDAAHVRIVEGDPLLFWRLRPNLRRVSWDHTIVTTNAQGLRYPRPVAAKAPGAFRIVCLGDSVTFGYQVPYVGPRRRNDDERVDLPYPALVERRLRSANPGRSIEVLPLAVPGYSSYQGLAWLRRDIGALEPDVVSACFGWNDISPRALRDRDAMKVDWLRVESRRLVSASQALSHLSVWLREHRGVSAAAPAGRWIMRVPQDEFVANLLAIARLAGDHGARALLVGPVYRDRETHPPEAELIALHRGALRRAARGAGIAYLEVPQLTEASFPSNRRYFAEHIHPNAAGHRLLADAIVDALHANGLLGGLMPGRPLSDP